MTLEHTKSIDFFSENENKKLKSKRVLHVTFKDRELLFSKRKIRQSYFKITAGFNYECEAYYHATI